MELLLKQKYAVYYLNDAVTTELLYGGGAGGGKSKFGCFWMISVCQKYPGTRWLMGRSKLKALKETTLNTFFETARDLGVMGDYKYNSQTNIITWENGSEILLKDLFLYPSDPEFDSLGSLEITGAFIDECNQCSYKAVQVVKSRIRYGLSKFTRGGELTKDLRVTKWKKRDDGKNSNIAIEWECSDGSLSSGLKPMLFMTCNPAKNWVYSDFYMPSLKGDLPNYRKFIQALPSDNPFLLESYLDSLRQLDKASRKRLLDGDWNYDDNPYSLFAYEDILGMFTSEWVKPDGDRWLTCDIAYTGSDRFVMCVWDGFVAIKIIVIDKIDDLSVSKVINDTRIEYRVPVKNVIYDSDGLQTFTRFSSKFGSLSGAIGFKNNGKAIKISGKVENFANLRSQCYFYFARLVKDGKIYIQDGVYRKQIIEEFEQINRLPNDEGGMQGLERKADLKERLKRSPDLADALFLIAYKTIRGQFKQRIIW